MVNANTIMGNINAFIEDNFSDINSKIVLSFDFDDTLKNHIRNDITNLKEQFLLSLIKNTEQYFSIITTSRSIRLFDITEYLIQHDVIDSIQFIIFNADPKEDVLGVLPIQIHFDDDINVIKKLYSKQRNGFLMGEFLSPQFLDTWFKSLDDSGHIKYFDETTIAQRRSLLT